MGKRFNHEEIAMKPMGSSSWNPLQLVGRLGQVIFNRQENPKFQYPTGYGETKLERKNEKIVELEKALEEEKRKAAKNEREKAKLEDKEKHRVADQKLKDLQLELENAKNKNNNNNTNKNGKFGVGNIEERPVWIGKKN